MDNQRGETTYNFILKKSYKDISIIGILKKLLIEHKINKYQYRESIHRIVNKKRLRSSVYSKVHFYLHTIKANTRKTTMIKLEQKDNSRGYVRFQKVDYQNMVYSVAIKKSKFLTLNGYTNQFLNDDYKNVMISEISNEFDKLMGGLIKS